MYAAKHRNDEAYIPDRDNAPAVLEAITRESNAAPVNSPARNMHAMLDSQFRFDAERLPSVKPFRPIVSLAIITAFCIASWAIITGFLLAVFW